MAYLVQADLDEQLPETLQIQLTDDEHLGVKHAGRIDGARQAAESEFESYASARYALPIQNVTEVAKMHMVVGWKYRLYSRRTVSEQMRTQYEDTILWYKDLAAGRATLGSDPPTPVSTLANSGAVYSEPRIFTRDSMGGF